MISKRSAGLYGAFGALLPELLRFSALVANQKISEPPSGWQTYFLVIFLYALAAGVLSIAWKRKGHEPCRRTDQELRESQRPRRARLARVPWKPDTEYKAIWVGASFPAIVHTLAATAAAHS